MAEVIPFARATGSRSPRALTQERLKEIAGLEFALKMLREDAYSDLSSGMPYLGTGLRLAPRFETRFSVLDGDATERPTGS